MGVWQNVRHWFMSPKQEAKPNGPTWSGEHFDFTSWNNTNLWGPTSDALSTNEEIFSVITRLANTVSSLPIHLYKDYDQVDNDVISLLTSRANPSETAYSLLNQLEVSRNKDGNGYLFIERNQRTGEPLALWPVAPSSVTIKRNLDDNSIWYNVISANPKYDFLVFNTEMIHVRHITPLTGVTGISPIQVLTGPLKFEKAIEDFSLNEMNKKDQYIIQYDRSVSPEKRQATINDFTRMVKANGGAVVQEKGFDFQRFQSNFHPSDLKTAESISKTQIANAFNVPVSFLNEVSAQNQMTEQAMIQFVQMTLIPIVRQYEAEFDSKLLTQSQRQQGYYFKFNVNGLMRGDTDARTKFYQMMIRNGIATQNDLRKLEDMPPLDDDSANVTWMSKDLYPSKSQMQASIAEIQQSHDEPAVKGGDNNGQQGNDDDAKVPDNQTGSQRNTRNVH